MKTVSVNGIDVAYQESGSGPPLLLLHGFSLDHTIWAPQVEALQGSYRLLVPDLRGMGRTGHSGGPISVAMMADDMAAFLGALDINAAAVAGFSLGGYILLEMVLRHPLKVRACGFISTRATADTEEGKKVRLQHMQTVIDEGMAGFAGHFIESLFAPDYIAAHPLEIEATQKVVLSQIPDSIASAHRRAQEARGADAAPFGEIAVPCLVFGGTGDALVPHAQMTALHEGLGDSVIELVEGAGHTTPLRMRGPGELPARPDDAARGHVDVGSGVRGC